MSYSILALDLDGTVIDSNYILSDSFVDFINRVKKRTIVCIATGRSVSDAMRYYRQLDLDSPLICYNGGFIWNPRKEEVLYTKTLENAAEILTCIMKEFPKNAIENVIVSCGEKTFYLNKKNPYMYDMLVDKELHHQKLFANTLMTNSVHRVVISTNIEYKQAIISRIRDIGQKHIKIFSWRDHQEIIDISIGTVNKWDALKMICDNLNVCHQKIISIGDGSNDIEMLQNSEIGICMKNAEEKTKQLCTIVSEFDCDHEGALKALKKYIAM